MSRYLVSRAGYLIFAAIAMTVVIVGPSIGRLHAQKSTANVNLSRKELIELIETAKTPAEHQKLAAYYRYKAGQARAVIAEHQEMLDAYLKNPSSHSAQPAKSVGGPVTYCQMLISTYKQEEKADLSLADYHEKMAKEAAGGKR